MLYDELVKKLRNRRICVQSGGDLEKDFPLLKQAADAIEELSRDLDSMNEANIALYGALPKWIPVTERLPEEAGAFITAYSKGGVSQNWYMTFHHGGGKWYQNSKDTGEVTHWMPLPTPPKEET